MACLAAVAFALPATLSSASLGAGALAALALVQQQAYGIHETQHTTQENGKTYSGYIIDIKDSSTGHQFHEDTFYVNGIPSGGGTEIEGDSQGYIANPDSSDNPSPQIVTGSGGLFWTSWTGTGPGTGTYCHTLRMGNSTNGDSGAGEHVYNLSFGDRNATGAGNLTLGGLIVEANTSGGTYKLYGSSAAQRSINLKSGDAVPVLFTIGSDTIISCQTEQQVNVFSDAIFEVGERKTLKLENYVLNVAEGKTLTIRELTDNNESVTRREAAGVNVTFASGITGSQGIVKMEGGSSMELGGTSTLGTLELPDAGSTIKLKDNDSNVTLGAIRPAAGDSGKLTIEGTTGTLNFAGQATNVTLVLNNSITYTGKLSIAVGEEGSPNATKLEVDSGLNGLGALTITLTGMLGKGSDWQGYQLFTSSGSGNVLTETQRSLFENSLSSDSYWRKCQLTVNGLVTLGSNYRDGLCVWKGAADDSWQERGESIWSTTPTGAASTVFATGSDAVFLAQGDVSTQAVTVSGEVHAHDLVVGDPDGGSGAFYTFNEAAEGANLNVSGDIIVSGTYGDEASPSRAVFNTAVAFSDSNQTITGKGTVEFANGGFSGTGFSIEEGTTVVVSDQVSDKRLSGGIVLKQGSTLALDLGVADEHGAITRGTVTDAYINTWNVANKVTGENNGGTLVLENIDGYWMTDDSNHSHSVKLMDFLSGKILPGSGKIGALVLRNTTLSAYGAAHQGVLAKVGKIVVESGSMFWIGQQSVLNAPNSPSLELHATGVTGSQGTITAAFQTFSGVPNATISNAVTLVADEGVSDGVVVIDTVGVPAANDDGIIIAGKLTIDPSVTLRKTGPGKLTLRGAIAADGGSKIDFQAGGLTLGSSFAGKVRIANGLTLTLGDGVSTGVEVGAGGEAELAINGYSGSVHSLSGGGKLVLSGSSKTLTFGTTGAEPVSAYLDGSTTLELKSSWEYGGTLELRKGWQQGERIQLEEGMPAAAVRGLKIEVYVDFGGNTVADQLLLNDGQGVQVFGAVEDGIRGALEGCLTIEGQDGTLRVEISKDGYVKLARKGAANLTWDGGDDAVWRTRGTTRWSKGTDVFTENDHVAFEAQEGEVIVPVSGGVTPGSVTVKGGEYIFAPADDGASIVTDGEFSVGNNAGIEIQLPATIGKLTGEGTLNVNSQGVVTIKDAAFSGDIELEQGGLVLDGDWGQEAGKVGLKIGDARRVTLRGGHGNSLSEVRLADGNSTGVIYLDPGARWRLEDVEVQSGQDLTIGGGSSGKKGAVVFGSEGAPEEAFGLGELSGGMLGLNAGQYSGNLGLKLSGPGANKGVKIRLGSGVTFSDLTLWIEVDENAVESLKEGWSYQLFNKFGDDFNTQRANLKLKALEPELLREKGCKFSLLADGTVIVERERKRYWDGKNGPLLWGDATATPWTDGESDQGLLWDNGVTVHEVHFEGKDGGDHEVQLVQEKLAAEELHVDGAATLRWSSTE